MYSDKTYLTNVYYLNTEHPALRYKYVLWKIILPEHIAVVNDLERNFFFFSPIFHWNTSKRMKVSNSKRFKMKIAREIFHTLIITHTFNPGCVIIFATRVYLLDHRGRRARHLEMGGWSAAAAAARRFRRARLRSSFVVRSRVRLQRR